MAGLVGYNVEGTLTLNGVSFNNPAFMVGGDETGQGSLLQLWGLMVERIGEDRPLPTATGVIPYPKRIGPAPFDLRFVCIGEVNSSGVPFADDRVGLYTNMAAVRAVIDTADDGTTGTVTASLTIPTGGPLTAAVHVLRLQHESSSISPNGKDGSYMEGTLQISIPSGRLV